MTVVIVINVADVTAEAVEDLLAQWAEPFGVCVSLGWICRQRAVISAVTARVVVGVRVEWVGLGSPNETIAVPVFVGIRRQIVVIVGITNVTR
jgi:hypothetical protein